MNRTATRDDFEKLSGVLLDFAKHHLTASNDIPPIVAMMGPVPEEELGPEGPSMRIGIMPVGMFQTEALGSRGKDFVAFLLQQMATQPDVLVAGYISEAWMSQGTAGADGAPEAPVVPPSQDPNRTECVILTLMSADCQAMQICPIVRKDDGVDVTVKELQFQGEGDLKFSGRFLREPRTIN